MPGQVRKMLECSVELADKLSYSLQFFGASGPMGSNEGRGFCKP
jgi:hypothetical protein